MKKILATLGILALLLSILAPLARAEGTGGVSADEMNVLVEQSALLFELRQKVTQLQYRYTFLEENIEMAQQNLDEAKESIADLELILSNLDEQIADTGRQSLNVKTQKEELRMELAEIQNQIVKLESQLKHEKEIVLELFSILYVKRNVYYTGENVDAIRVLASPNSVSQTLQEITYLNMIREETQKHMNLISELSDDLVTQWDLVRVKQGELDSLDARLSEEALALQNERDHQQEILDETLAEKSILEIMLTAVPANHEDLQSELRIYQNNIEMLENSLTSADSLLSEEQKETLALIQSEMSAKYSIDDSSDFLDLDWPVSPSGGLSAFFHDLAYQATFGVDHYAVDIRVKQGTPIYAPADGVVQSVVFDPASTRYAYLTVAHRKGVSTLYGHLSSPVVAIGDYVVRGQLIGYTGGSPNSIGAGARTTGPHLHFEVWQDGVRADPLQYLPLEELPLDTVPPEYLIQVQEALEARL